MSALAGIGVLVEVRAIEFGEAVGVTREVGGSLVEQDADAGVVPPGDKLPELHGRSVTAGGGEVADGLIAPGAVEGVLHDGEELDMGVAEILYVGEAVIREF